MWCFIQQRIQNSKSFGPYGATLADVVEQYCWKGSMQRYNGAKGIASNDNGHELDISSHCCADSPRIEFIPNEILPSGDIEKAFLATSQEFLYILPQRPIGIVS